MSIENKNNGLNALQQVKIIKKAYFKSRINLIIAVLFVLIIWALIDNAPFFFCFDSKVLNAVDDYEHETLIYINPLSNEVKQTVMISNFGTDVDSNSKRNAYSIMLNKTKVSDVNINIIGYGITIVNVIKMKDAEYGLSEKVKKSAHKEQYFLLKVAYATWVMLINKFNVFITIITALFGIPPIYERVKEMNKKLNTSG